MYSYLNGLRISGQDANTIWSQSNSVTIIAGPTSSNVNLSVGNGNILVKVSNTGTTMNSNTSIYSLGIGMTADGIQGDLTVNNNIFCNTFYTAIGNNIVNKVQNVFSYATTGGPFSTGYWLTDISKYVSQSGYTYLTFNVSSPTLNFVWLGRVAVSSSGVMAQYVDYSSNVQLNYNTTGGNFLQVTCSTTATGAIYYKITG